jgi:exodeoxyribonuclease V alpha subunit
VLSGERLYLRRYWRYERRIDHTLRQRLAQAEAPLPTCQIAWRSCSRRGASGQVDWQKLACALATRAGFSIITGGPGTGKTTTVVRLLALLQAPAVEQGRPLRIRLAAPTGKAAARLTESIGQQVERCKSAPKCAGKSPLMSAPCTACSAAARARGTSATTPATRCRWMCWWSTRRR